MPSAGVGGDLTASVSGNASANITGSLSADIGGSLTAESSSAAIKANSVTVDSPSIDLGKGGQGVVTGECLCMITGNPHGDKSSNTRAKK